MSTDTARIAALNDTFRTTLQAGCVLVTSGIRALGEEAIRAVLDQVRSFSAFDPDNDPHEEHDFGSFDHRGQAIFWKIDYFDAEMRYGSENPADAAKTTRVL